MENVLPLPGDAFDQHASVVDVDNVFDDRQPQAGAPQLAAAASVDAVKPLEDSRQMLRGDATALILDDDHDFAVFGACLS